MGQKRESGRMSEITSPGFKSEKNWAIRMKSNNPQPRIDQVYLYSGDLNADGKKEHGIVNFFRDRVVSYQSPFK